jgi:hypothetical protein
MVAMYYKDIFADLDKFSKYLRLHRSDRLPFCPEIQFFLSWHDYIALLGRRAAVLIPSCAPAKRSFTAAAALTAMAFRMRGRLTAGANTLSCGSLRQ